MLLRSAGAAGACLAIGLVLSLTGHAATLSAGFAGSAWSPVVCLLGVLIDRLLRQPGTGAEQAAPPPSRATP